MSQPERSQPASSGLTITEYRGAVGGLVPLLKTAAPSVPGVNQLPGIRRQPVSSFEPFGLSRTGVQVIPAQVRGYEVVCAFPHKDTLPVPFVHLLAFPLHLAIMSDARFPWPAMGAVHLENRIRQYRPLRLADRFDVTVTVAMPRAHAKGTLLDFTSQVNVAGDLVWEEVSTYLVRGRSADSAATAVEAGPTVDLPPAPIGTTTWRLPADLGRRYGSVSGDVNPIHLTALTAKALGFRRQIVHGMWSMARCVAAIENRLPDRVQIDTAFKKPIFLPSSVAFGLHTETDPQAPQGSLLFGLTSPRDGSPHVVGRTSTF